MPRYSLKRSPWTRITSPGASSVPASMRAEHHRVGARADRLRDVARGGDAAVGDHRHAVLGGDAGDVVDRGDLRDADAGDDARRADPGRPDADLDGIRARVDQRARRLGRRDVPGDDLDRDGVLDPPHHLDHALGMAVRRVDDDHVRRPPRERLGALERVRPDADGGADAQPALLVLRRLGELDLLLDVLDGDQAAQPAVGVDDRQLLDLVPVEDLLGLRERRARPAR